ncbi:hypothetical protein BD770DRAFT_317597, partial [Pilaira anomala]
IKSIIKRSPLGKADKLTYRLSAACGSVIVQDCQDWVKYAEIFWVRCIDNELGLR